MKKTLALLLSLTLLQFSSSVYAADVVYGDANGDGLITADDASVILEAARTGEMPGGDMTDAEKIAAFDLDFSGTLTANDATLVLYKTLNPGYELPVEAEMNREIQPGSLIISRMNGDSEIFNGMDFELNQSRKIYEITSKAELDGFIEAHPAINGESLKERINGQYGKNWFANQKLVIACAMAGNLQDEYTVKDIVLSEGALEIHMDSVTPEMSSPLLDSRLIIINVDRDLSYDSIKFYVDYYNTLYPSGLEIPSSSEVWETKAH